MKSLRKKLASQKGFTLVEIALYVVLVGILFNIAAQTMMVQVDSYAFISDRKGAMSDARYVLNRISYDVMRLEVENISAFNADSIYFEDYSGISTDYHVQGTNLMKGNEIFLEGIQSFALVVYDDTGAITNDVEDARQFKFTVVTQPKNDEGSVTLTTTVTPRTLLYAGYQ